MPHHDPTWRTKPCGQWYPADDRAAALDRHVVRSPGKKIEKTMWPVCGKQSLDAGEE
jgi:hypothetical protein